MNATPGNEFSVRKPNEALFNVVVGSHGARRRAMPQVHYGFDHATYQGQARDVWEGLRRDGGLPPAASLKAMVVPLFRVHSVLFEFARHSDAVTVPFIGLEVARMSRLGARPAGIHDAPQDSVFARLPSFFPRVLDGHAPVEFSALAAVGPQGGTTFNGILLPFQDSDGHVSHIYAILDQNASEAVQGDVFDLTDDFLAEEIESDTALRADLDVLELELEQVLLDIAERDDASAMPPSAVQDTPLSEALGMARGLAREVAEHDGRSRAALYRALGQAYVVAHQAVAAPVEYAALLLASGIATQERAPMTPIVKLVFGKQFDRTRITEYAAVLTFAQAEGVDVGQFADFLAGHDGGIKGVVAAWRSRRRAGARPVRARRSVRASAARQYRALPARPLAALSPEGAEFGVMLFRRMTDGSVVMLGELSDDPATIERVGHKLVARAQDGDRVGA